MQEIFEKLLHSRLIFIRESIGFFMPIYIAIPQKEWLLLYLRKPEDLQREMDVVEQRNRGQKCVRLLDQSRGIFFVWDGTPRIRSCLHHFLGADESDYVEEMLKHFLLGAIRRVFRPGSKYEEMLCLVGGQGAGKSSFFRLLAIRDEWFSDDLKKLDDDRVFLKLQGHWIIEMSEMLATSSAKSIEEIRSFISRQKETYRTPYEAQPNKYYASILTEYQQAEENGFSGDSSTDPNVNKNLLRYGGNDLFYTLIDLCNDGVPELFISEQRGSDSPNYEIVDIYGYEDGAPQHLNVGIDLGESPLDPNGTMGDRVHTIPFVKIICSKKLTAVERTKKILPGKN